MASINDLIQQIENPELRNRIQSEIKKLAKQKKFGLVFEEHLPECTPLYDVPVTVGKNVSLKDGKANETYKVVDIINNEVVCIKNGVEEPFTFDINKVVVTAVFGEPIYPYLKPIDSICNAPDSNLWHTLIEADNYHALQLLEYLYAGKVDCIYIDPPYNTGAKDWKYNNNYVDENDAYRHSKWLSFMQKRLIIAKKLLNQQDSVLIITIDEKEYYHLGCLLEDIFPEANIQMISMVINRRGTIRTGEFSRTNEFVYFVMIGKSSPNLIYSSEGKRKDVKWVQFRRSDLASKRGTSKGGIAQFYPIYINNSTKRIVEVGNALSPEIDRHSVKDLEGCSTVFPVRKDGTEMNWGLTAEEFKRRVSKGYVRIGKYDKDANQQYTISYLTTSYINDIETGKAQIIGYKDDGSVKCNYIELRGIYPTTQWNSNFHDAKTFGTDIIDKILGKNKFSFPKSIYSVKDVLNLFVINKKNAFIVDFFAGSGTTLNAVNMLNYEDNGHRRCIMITNNEVSEKEANILKSQGFTTGDYDWEKFGIARYVTWPRTKCSILGVDINGKLLDGEYTTYLKKEVRTARKINQVVLDNSLLSFETKKSLIGLMGKNVLPQSLIKEETHYIVSEKYTTSIIFNLEYVDEWLAELEENSQVTDIYIVTDNDKVFKKLKAEVSELLGPIVTEEPLKIPMSEGFEANVEYFKLGFLDKTAVKIGRQFKELLPILWMKSGSVGPRPIIEGESIPDMLVLPINKMAILVNENKFYDFKEQVDQHSEIEYVYIVTNYEQGYRSKISQLNVSNTYQLYRDYLDNFRINYRRANQ